MRDFPQDTTLEVPDRDANLFTHTALLALPEPWRAVLLDVGQWVYRAALEDHGIAPGLEGSLIAARCRALAADVETVAVTLSELAEESSATEGLTPAEVDACTIAREGVAVAVVLAARVHRAAATVDAEGLDVELGRLRPTKPGEES